nr:GspH/FimT family pseudopilin [Luteimonas suaedae]
MVTIVILGVVLAIGFPNFQVSIRSNRVATASNELLASLSLARSEAIRNPGGAGFCASTAGTDCDGSWGDGWMVWIDADGNRLPGGVNDRVVRFVEARDTLNITTDADEDEDDSIFFDHQGRKVGAGLEFTISSVPCPAGQQLSRQLRLSSTGQAAITPMDCPS